MQKVLLGCLFVSLLLLNSCTTKESQTYSEQCISYCSCLDLTCSSYEKYPYESKEQCLSVCSKLTDKETACWSYFCSQKDDSMQEHLCEHALGEFGLDECPS